jgi:hypothetical protein
MFRRFLGRLFQDAVPLVHRPAESKGKVILLLGFGGSKRKNFAKLINSYNSSGYTVISHTNPLLTPNFISDSFERQIGEVLQNTINELETEYSTVVSSGRKVKIPLIAHIYSNNGTWVYASLMKKCLIREADGLIFDSAPYLVYKHMSLYAEASIFTRVITSVVLGEAKYHHPLYSPIIRGILLPGFAIRRLLEHTPFVNDFLLYDYLELNEYLRDRMPVLPSMFIYSKGDKLVPKESIEEFMNLLKKRYFKIETVEFGEDVGHTGSFYKYKEAYINKVFHFIDSLMNK